MNTFRWRLVIAGFVASCVLLLLWVLWWEPGRLTTNDVQITSSRWSLSCQGTKIALLADLHIGSPHYDIDKLKQVVATTNARQPDLILLAGDFVIHGVLGGDFVDPNSIAVELAQLQAPHGVFAVLGNHDWWYNADAIATALTNNGVHLLEDRAMQVTDGQCNYWLAGVSDFWEGPHDIVKALADVPATAPVIVFTHNPDIFVDIPPRVAVTFAGHTHGGQVNLPLLGRLIVPSDYGERFAIGHIIEDGRHLYVNPGLGTSILPVRFRVPPEITQIVLNGSTLH